MRVAGQILDRADGHPGRLQVDDQLRQAAMALGCRTRRPHQRDHVVGATRVGCHDFLAVEAPARCGALGPGASACEVRSRFVIPRPDAYENFTAPAARQTVPTHIYATEL